MEIKKHSINVNLQGVLRCIYYLDELKKARPLQDTYVDKYNNLWGELDWLEELHRLLYENV